MFYGNFHRPDALYITMNGYWDGVLDDLYNDLHGFRTPQEEVEYVNLYERAHAERDWANTQIDNEMHIAELNEQMD